MNVQRTKKLQNTGRGHIIGRGSGVKLLTRGIPYASMGTGQVAIASTSKAAEEDASESVSSAGTSRPTFLLPPVFKKSKSSATTSVITPQFMLKTSTSSLAVPGTSSMVTPVYQNRLNRTGSSSGYRNNTSTSSARRPQNVQKTPRQKTPGQRTPKSGGTTTTSEGNSCIVALTEGRGLARGEVGIAALDIQCPQLYLCQISDNHTYSKTLIKINAFNPVEIIFPNTLCEETAPSQLYKCVGKMFPNVMLSKIFRRHYNDGEGLQRIKGLIAPQFSSVELIIVQKFYALSCAAALLKYVEYTHNIFFSSKSLKVEYQTSQNTTLIDVETASRLEVVKNLCGNSSKHSLMGIMNHCQTKGGARLLRANLLQPPCNRKVIETRLECVQELLASPELFQTLPKMLCQLNEVDSLLSLSIHVPQEDNIKMAEKQIKYLVLLKMIMEMMPCLRNALEDCHSKFLRSAYEVLLDENYAEILEKVLKVVSEDIRISKGSSLSHIQLNFALKHGISAWLDIGRKTYTELVNDMSELVANLAKKHKLPLRMSYSSSWGYHIQLPMGKPKLKESDLPPEFIQVHKLRNSFTFTTETLVAMDRRSKAAMENIQAINNSIICEVLEDIRKDIGFLYKLCDMIAELDMLMSFATVSCVPSYVAPTFNDFLRLKQARHPMLDYVAHTEPVPNDVFSSYHYNCHIITGPNMSGKSIYIRMIALLHIMAQVGCYVPAESATFRITDRIFSRLCFNDSIECNASTFVLELREIKIILQNTTSTSLIILDELCRGTSSEEGTAVAWVIMEELIVNTQAYIFLTTHFLFLTNLEDMYPNVINHYFEVLEAKTEKGREHLIYTHKLLPGVTNTEHYGLRLVKSLPFPPLVIEKAYEYAEKLKSQYTPNAKRGIFAGIISNTDREMYKLMADLKQKNDEGTLTIQICKELQHKLRMLMIDDESNSVSDKSQMQSINGNNVRNTNNVNKDESNVKVGDTVNSTNEETSLKRQVSIENSEAFQAQGRSTDALYGIYNNFEAYEPIQIIDLHEQGEDTETAAAPDVSSSHKLSQVATPVLPNSEKLINPLPPVSVVQNSGRLQRQEADFASPSIAKIMMDSERFKAQLEKCYSCPVFGNRERNVMPLNSPQTDITSPMAKKLKKGSYIRPLYSPNNAESEAVLSDDAEGQDDEIRSSNVTTVNLRSSTQTINANAESFRNFMLRNNDSGAFAFGSADPILIGMEETRKSMRLLFGSQEEEQCVEQAISNTEDAHDAENDDFGGIGYSVIQPLGTSSHSDWQMSESEQEDVASESDEENIIYPSPQLLYSGAPPHNSI